VEANSKGDQGSRRAVAPSDDDDDDDDDDVQSLVSQESWRPDVVHPSTRLVRPERERKRQEN
jgi:hypothetical protein